MILLATQNAGKIKEIKTLLASLSFEWISLSDLPNPPRIREDGKTFEENAVKKAVRIAKHYGMRALADDSGLEIDALHGAPGVRSARFAGPGGTHQALCQKVLRLMRKVPEKRRTARFVCVLAFAIPGRKVRTIRGICEGKIAYSFRGTHGFAYDSIFIPNGFKRTFGELSPRTKNRVSHRFQALKKMKAFLRKI